MLVLSRLLHRLAAAEGRVAHLWAQQAVDAPDPQERVGVLLPQALPAVALPQSARLCPAAGAAGPPPMRAIGTVGRRQAVGYQGPAQGGVADDEGGGRRRRC